MDFIHVLHKQVYIYILIIGLSELKTNVKNLAQNRWKTPPFNTQKGKVLNIITLYKIIRCSVIREQQQLYQWLSLAQSVGSKKIISGVITWMSVN